MRQHCGGLFVKYTETPHRHTRAGLTFRCILLTINESSKKSGSE
jgi:hypothetical protein